MSEVADRPWMLSDDRRAELVAGATAAERRAQPTILLVLGVALLLMSVVYLLVSLWQRGSAELGLALDRSDAERIVRLVADLQGARGTDVGSEEQLKPDQYVMGKIQKILTESSLAAAQVDENAEGRDDKLGLHRKRYNFRLQSQPAAALMGWIARVTREVEGVELQKILVNPGTGTPEGARWNAEVTFVRWERTGEKPK